jgi:hypothetical protein
MGKMSHQKQSVLGQNGKKEHKIHQVKRLQRNKMPLRDKMSQFMGKVGHKTHEDKL